MTNAIKNLKSFLFLLVILFFIHFGNLFSQTSINNLQSRLDSLFASDYFQSTQIAIEVYDLSNNKPVLSKNEKLLMRPASVEKILTTCTALKFLDEDYNFKTKIYHTGEIDDSICSGDLYVVGGFDPDFTSHDLDSMVSEIKNYGIKEILFYDDTFTVYKSNVLKLCGMIIKNKTDITWTCFARVDFIDEEMLKKMKEAGCHQIMYGVESTNGAVLKNINKKIQIKQVIKAVEWTKKAKIECRVAFMVGNPKDTTEIIKENIKFVNKIDPDLLVVNITTPFPGTAMFNWAKEKDLILTYDWDEYDLSKPVMKLENMSADEIVKLYNMMYRGFYLRPSFMLKKILSVRNFSDFMNLSDGFKSVLSFLNK